MKNEVLKGIVNGVVTAAKEHMVITLVTCSVVVGAAGVGGVVTYHNAHTGNNSVVESDTEVSVKDSSYKKLETRFKAAKTAISELILDEKMSAKLNSDAEEIRAYIENSNTKSVEDDMLKKMDELEKNVKKETDSSIKKLADKETEVANLVATTNAPKFIDSESDSSEETQTQEESTEESSAAIVLDDESLTTLDELKEEYFSLKKENKYKSAYNKCGDIINLIQNYASNHKEENSETDTNENGNDAPANADNGNTDMNTTTSAGNTTSANNSGNGGGAPANAGSGSTDSQNTSSPAAQPEAPAQPSNPEPQPEAPTQPSNSKAGVAETFYDGSIANGITGDQKAYIDGLVNSWLNGGYTNEGLEDAIADYLIENGYEVNRVTALKNSIMAIPDGMSYTLNGVTTGNELYYYGKCYTDGEMNGDMRVGYYNKVSVS